MPRALTLLGNDRTAAASADYALIAALLSAAAIVAMKDAGVSVGDLIDAAVSYIRAKLHWA